MSLKIVVDMNLSPEWVPVLEKAGWIAVHWSAVGDPRAPDQVIMDWAETNESIVFTHDLDFGAALALTHRSGPSVLQVRTEDVLPDSLGTLVTEVIRQNEAELRSGALIVVDERKQHVRILPM